MNNNKVRIVMRVMSFVVVVLLGACGPGGTPSGPVGQTVTPASTATGGDLIVLKTSGSIAGVDRELRISGSGLATLYDRGELKATRQMNSSTLPEIEGLLQDGDFFSLQDRYDKGNVGDDIYYELTYTKGGRSKSVTVAEVGGQGLTPKRVLDVIAKLTQFEWQMSYKRQP